MTREERLKKIAIAFDDSEANSFFVSLYRTRINYTKLVETLSENYKMIVVAGPPGTGKTYTLWRFHNEQKDKYNLYFYKTPTFDLTSLAKIYADLSQQTISEPTHTELIMALKDLGKDITIILDEAQLYSDEQMEFVRILSDESFFRVMLCINENKKKSIISTKQFETRVYKYINFASLEKKEVRHFVEEKLLLADASNYFLKFSPKTFRIIMSFTLGNIRDLNRILNRAFVLLSSNINDSLNVDTKQLNKYIEMAAIDLELVDNKKILGFL